MLRTRADLFRSDTQLRLPIRAAPDRAGHNGPVSGAVISLFAGAGGLDLGVEQAGFRTVAAVEWDEDAADSMEKNAPAYFPELREVLRANLYPFAAGSNEGIGTKDILRAGGLSGRNRPDLLVTGAVHDPRVMVREPAKWVAALRHTDPEWSPRLLFRCETAAGAHVGPSGRIGHLAYEAEIYAWILDRLGVSL